MISRRFAFLWVLLLFIFQNALSFIFYHQTPPFLVMAVVFYGLFGGPYMGIYLGAFSGFLLDLIGVGGLGTQTALLGGIGFFAGLTASNIFRESFVTHIILSAGASFGLVLANMVLAEMAQGGAAFQWELVSQAFKQSNLLTTAVLSPFFFYYFRKLSRVERRRRYYWGQQG